MTTKIRRNIGFVLTVLTSIIAGYALAWNGNWIGELLATSDGLFTLILGIGVIAIVALVVFWPEKWSSKTRSALTLIALLAALFIGGEPIRAAFMAAPWVVVGLLIGFSVVLWILYGLTVSDNFPTPRRLKTAYSNTRNRKVSNQATIKTPAIPAKS